MTEPVIRSRLGKEIKRQGEEERENEKREREKIA